MFDNIGGKIKALAKVFCWIGIIASVIYAIVNFVASGQTRNNDGYILAGYMFLFLGPLVSWISSFVLYGFGQLIENTSENASLLRKIAGNNKGFNNTASVSEVDELRNRCKKGEISETQYCDHLFDLYKNGKISYEEYKDGLNIQQS